MNSGETIRTSVPRMAISIGSASAFWSQPGQSRREDVPPDHVQQDHRQDQAERLPRPEDQVATEPARRHVPGPDLERPLREKQAPPDQELNQQDRAGKRRSHRAGSRSPRPQFVRTIRDQPTEWMIQPYTTSERTVRSRTPSAYRRRTRDVGMTGLRDLRGDPEARDRMPGSRPELIPPHVSSTRHAHVRDAGSPARGGSIPKASNQRDQQGNGHHRWFEPEDRSPRGPSAPRSRRTMQPRIAIPSHRARMPVSVSRGGGPDHDEMNRIDDRLALPLDLERSGKTTLQVFFSASWITAGSDLRRRRCHQQQEDGGMARPGRLGAPLLQLLAGGAAQRLVLRRRAGAGRNRDTCSHPGDRR